MRNPFTISLSCPEMGAAEIHAFIEGMCLAPGQVPTFEQWERLKGYVTHRVSEEHGTQKIEPPKPIAKVRDVRPGEIFP